MLRDGAKRASKAARPTESGPPLHATTIPLPCGRSRTRATSTSSAAPGRAPRVVLVLARRALEFALVLALGNRLALIPNLLAARKPDLHFDHAAGKIHPQRHEREPFLRGARFQVADLRFVQEQLA